jgi:hypothetical protein
MIDKEWLESLKEGDAVYVPGNYGAVGTIEKVKRLTATQVIVETKAFSGEAYETRYRKSDGFLVGGDGYARGHITEVTDDHRELIARMAMRNFIHRVAWKDVPTGKLKRIVAILKEGSK